MFFPDQFVNLIQLKDPIQTNLSLVVDVAILNNNKKKIENIMNYASAIKINGNANG